MASAPSEAYVELVLKTGGGGVMGEAPSAEELSEVLMEYGAMSVTASDSNAGTELEEALYGEPPDAKELDVFLVEADKWRSEAYWRSAEGRCRGAQPVTRMMLGPAGGKEQLS